MTFKRWMLTTPLFGVILGGIHGCSSITIPSYYLKNPDDRINFIAIWELINLALLIKQPDYGLGVSLNLFYTIMWMRNHQDDCASMPSDVFAM